MSAVQPWADAMSIASHRRAHGFSLLELIIVITLVALLFLVALNRLAPLRGDAEAAHVATVIGSLRSAIGLETAQRVIRHGLGSLADLQSTNPMDLLQETPEQYLGAYTNPTAAEIHPGAWYFDESEGLLVYRVRFPHYLENSPSGPIELKWQVRLQVERSAAGARQPSGHISGLSLEPLHEHRWPPRRTSEAQSVIAQ
jgi:prepilin-type N-terminal cleavage/methylation domain-containing protein